VRSPGEWWPGLARQTNIPTSTGRRHRDTWRASAHMARSNDGCGRPSASMRPGHALGPLQRVPTRHCVLLERPAVPQAARGSRLAACGSKTHHRRQLERRTFIAMSA